MPISCGLAKNILGGAAALTCALYPTHEGGLWAEKGGGKGHISANLAGLRAKQKTDEEVVVNLELAPTATLYYEPVHDVAQCQMLVDRLAEPVIYEIALCLGFIPTVAEFSRMVTGGEIDIWRVCRAGAPEPLAYAIDSHRFVYHRMYVYEPAGWNSAVVVEAVGAMGVRVFGAEASVDCLFTALPLPLPPGSEEALYSLGYDHVPSDSDRTLKKTYGLKRAVHIIYTTGA